MEVVSPPYELSTLTGLGCGEVTKTCSLKTSPTTREDALRTMPGAETCSLPLPLACTYAFCLGGGEAV